MYVPYIYIYNYIDKIAVDITRGGSLTLVPNIYIYEISQLYTVYVGLAQARPNDTIITTIASRLYSYLHNYVIIMNLRPYLLYEWLYNILSSIHFDILCIIIIVL